MSLLDRLLPGNYLSNVEATFAPKRYDFVEQGEDFLKDFTPMSGESGTEILDLYKRLQAAGIHPTEKMADKLMGAGRPGGDDPDRRLPKTHAAMMQYEYTMWKALEDAGEPLSDADRARMQRVKELHADKVALSRKRGVGLGDFGALEVDNAFVKTSGETINPFASGSLAEGFRQAGVSDFDADMATTTALGALRKIDPSSYAKEISEKRGTLADRLVAQQQSAQQAGSGFAGYGGRTVGQELAQQQYESGVQDIYSGVAQQRGQALQDLYSQLDDYGRLISQQQGE